MIAGHISNIIINDNDDDDEGTISQCNGRGGDRGLRREQHAASTGDDLVALHLHLGFLAYIHTFIVSLP